MTNRPLVLFISSWYPNRITPTNGDFVQRHAKAVSLYCDVIFLHVMFDPSLKRNFERIEKKENNYHEIIIYFNTKSLFKFIQQLKKSLGYYKYYRTGYKQICQTFQKPDIIHSNIIWPVSLIALILKKLHNIPYIISEHYTKYLLKKKIPFIERILSKLMIKNAGYVSPVTNNLKNALLKYNFHGKYKTVPNVVDTINFKPDLGIENEKAKIVHISSLLDEHKNITGILNVIKKLASKRNDFELHIIGPLKKELIDKTKKMELHDHHVFLHDQKKHDEIPDFLNKCSFLLMFSNYENLPCVIVEALASGIPVVSTEVGGINEYISNHKNGLLVKAGDETELMQSINFMIDNYHKFDKIMLHEFAVENFSFDAIGARFSNIYKELIK